MSFQRRIYTIYTKELVDILRDRRTLVAMIVVPIVLYPLLMLGSIQAVGFQAESMVRERIVIGVIDQAQGKTLHALIERDKHFLNRKRLSQSAQTDLDPSTEDEFYFEWPEIEVRDFGGVARLESLIREREIPVGIVFDSALLYDDLNIQNQITLYHDKENIRSFYAQTVLAEMIQRAGLRTVDRRKREANLPSSFDKPFLVESVDLSSPPSILGQVLPLILILMTITGAIYPAIDLTAGERERGTLESLMASPVLVFDLIVGKFLVVTTVAIFGAALNLGSVTATVYFGGFDQIIANTGGSLPLGTMFVILLCLIPFAVLMSAIMMAVCSFARTFKEAQNYVTPVILAVLIPGGIAALPTTQLDGIMLVIPVGNMVLLTRELLVGAAIPGWHIATVLMSTTLYAVAAIGVAASVFGKESVVFADSGSLRGFLTRSLMKPSSFPVPSFGLLVVALLFPTWFFVQSALGPKPGEDATSLLSMSGMLLPLLFVFLPAGLMAYAKISLRSALSIRWPQFRFLLAALILGATAWIPAHMLSVLQEQIIGVPRVVVESAEQMQQALLSLPLSSVILLIAIAPAICEELLFRGFLQGSVGSTGRKWTAILTSAVIFGVFHFFLFKFVVIASLGILLGYLCWQSRSILPAIMMHMIHNAIGATQAVRPEWFVDFGIGVEDGWAHLSPTIMVVGGLLFLFGIGLTSKAGLGRSGYCPTMEKAGR